MKIIIYCQHVLGVGHFFRTLEICRALDQHQVVLVSGGPETPAPLPPHVRRLQLPELAMDHAFQNLHATDGQSVTQTRASRRAMLEHLFREETPDLFLIELYPLGRKAFRDELDPVLAQIRDGRLPPCRVVCSVRDILVEKENQDRHEKRAVDTLNRWFDALLIHADPSVIRLDATFDRMDDIRIPVAYTGFVASPVRPAGNRTRLESRPGHLPGTDVDCRQRWRRGGGVSAFKCDHPGRPPPAGRSADSNAHLHRPLHGRARGPTIETARGPPDSHSPFYG